MEQLQEPFNYISYIRGEDLKQIPVSYTAEKGAIIKRKKKTKPKKKKRQVKREPLISQRVTVRVGGEKTEPKKEKRGIYVDRKEQQEQERQPQQPQINITTGGGNPFTSSGFLSDTSNILKGSIDQMGRNLTAEQARLRAELEQGRRETEQMIRLAGQNLQRDIQAQGERLGQEGKKVKSALKALEEKAKNMGSMTKDEMASLQLRLMEILENQGAYDEQNRRRQEKLLNDTKQYISSEIGSFISSMETRQQEPRGSLTFEPAPFQPFGNLETKKPRGRPKKKITIPIKKLEEFETLALEQEQQQEQEQEEQAIGVSQSRRTLQEEE